LDKIVVKKKATEKARFDLDKVCGAAQRGGGVQLCGGKEVALGDKKLKRRFAVQKASCLRVALSHFWIPDHLKPAHRVALEYCWQGHSGCARQKIVATHATHTNPSSAKHRLEI
jgi:hypothetical protein